MSNIKDYITNPTSYWVSTTKDTDYPEAQDVSVDTAIVGGGLCGITAAYLLKKEGQRVAVIDAHRICKGTTAHSTAKITLQHNIIYSKIAGNMGMEKAEQYADANKAALDFISNEVKSNNIDCDFSFVPAYLYSCNDDYTETFEKESEIVSKFGVKSYITDNLKLPFKINSALCYENQAQFHPRKYVLFLSQHIAENGSYIFENSTAVDIQKENNNKYSVITDKSKKITADNVIIATHFPFYDNGGMYFTRMYPEKTYLIAIKTDEQISGGMFLGLDMPYSFRKQTNGTEDLLIVVGEPHKTGHGGSTIKHFENIIHFAKKTFNTKDIPYNWSTQDCMTMDSIPYIGRLTTHTPNLYVATGFNKWGITGSTAAALIIRDMIMGKDNPWKEVFSPDRFDLSGSAVEFLKQNYDVAKNYVSGKVAELPKDIDVKNGEAKVVEVEGKKVGAYRDDNGVLHVVDTTCTHLGCELKWNDAEKTWECPCHGSRFTFDGNLIEGPAHLPLNHMNDDKNKIDPNIT